MSTLGTGLKFEIARNVVDCMASDALRTVALAYSDNNCSTINSTHDRIECADCESKGSEEYPDLEEDLILIAIIGIQDPIRPEVMLV